MKEINLTRGFVAIVDDEDFIELSKHKWLCDSNGYAARCIDLDSKKRKFVRMHIFIMGKIEGLCIDHINGKKTDNRRCNLRHVTTGQNQFNQAACRGGSSQYKGVVWHKVRKIWQAYIKINRKQHYLGIYRNEADAAMAYNEAAINYFGEYARLNTLAEIDGRRYG